jgi:hypothetical protein
LGLYRKTVQDFRRTPTFPSGSDLKLLPEEGAEDQQGGSGLGDEALS